MDLSDLKSLTELICHGNQLMELDVSKLSNLQTLVCDGNQLTKLDVSGLSNLQVLGCLVNQLTELDVSNLYKLRHLSCGGNNLTKLDISGLNLELLECGGNKLTDLDVLGQSNLRMFLCNNNQLTNLDLSGLSNLQWLNCDGNQLTDIDLSGLNLERLSCGNNQLTELNVSGLSNLQWLYCDNNQLTELNLTGLNALTSFNGSDQTVSLTLKESGSSYTTNILLNNPSNLVGGLSYAGGTLTSNNNTIASSPFTVQTGLAGRELSGTLNITYQLAATVAVTGVTLDKSSVTMRVAENEQLTATVLPANATNRNVTWSSSDASVAIVSASGLITAIAQGTAVITVTSAENSALKATCAVEVRKQDVSVGGGTQTGDDGHGSFVLSLTIPADVLFSGSFVLVLPDGVQLDVSVTHLADDLASKLTLRAVQKADGSWIFTITPQILRSAAEMNYSQIVEIGYMIDKTATQHTYKASIQDLSFAFDNGAQITENEIPIVITNNASTGIPELFAQPVAYINSGRLYVDSPGAEIIQVYSVSGLLLNSFVKQEGKASYPVDNAQNSIVIVKGTSGWVRKISTGQRY